MEDYEFIDKAVWIRKEKILVITDLHIGFEEGLNEIGVFLPREQYKKIIQDLDRIFNKAGKVNEIIILGDLKHEFGEISRQEWKEVLDFLDFAGKNCDKIILVKGNHDSILEPIARIKNIEIKDFYIKKNMAFIHGNKAFTEIYDKGIKTIFMGHLHPAISIREGVKNETYKCFLAGKWKGKKIAILPSFFPLVEGSDVSISETNLAIRLNLDNFKVYIPAEDKVLDFGKVKNVGKLS